MRNTTSAEQFHFDAIRANTALGQCRCHIGHERFGSTDIILGLRVVEVETLRIDFLEINPASVVIVDTEFVLRRRVAGEESSMEVREFLFEALDMLFEGANTRRACTMDEMNIPFGSDRRLRGEGIEDGGQRSQAYTGRDEHNGVGGFRVGEEEVSTRM